MIVDLPPLGFFMLMFHMSLSFLSINFLILNSSPIISQPLFHYNDFHSEHLLVSTPGYSVSTPARTYTLLLLSNLFHPLFRVGKA